MVLDKKIGKKGGEKKDTRALGLWRSEIGWGRGPSREAGEGAAGGGGGNLGNCVVAAAYRRKCSRDSQL